MNMVALSSQQLVHIPASTNNYRCSVGTVLVTDTGVVSDAEEQMCSFTLEGISPYQANLYESQLYLPNQHCTWLIQPQSGMVGPDGQRRVRFTFSKFELEDGIDFLRFYASDAPSPYTLVKSFTGPFSSHEYGDMQHAGCWQEAASQSFLRSSAKASLWNSTPVPQSNFVAFVLSTKPLLSEIYRSPLSR